MISPGVKVLAVQRTCLISILSPLKKSTSPSLYVMGRRSPGCVVGDAFAVVFAFEAVDKSTVSLSFAAAAHDTTSAASITIANDANTIGNPARVIGFLLSSRRSSIRLDRFQGRESNGNAGTGLARQIERSLIQLAT